MHREDTFLSNKVLDSVDLPDCNYPFFYDPSGREHYRLLNVFCAGKDLVFDVGTYKGLSALAMSSAEVVVSYDIEQQRDDNLKRSNIQYCIGDVMQDERLLKADIILIDTYHLGDFELAIHSHLVSNDYKGIIIYDDIFLNNHMKNFWDNIKEDKVNFTDIGHYTGTGVVYL